VQNNSTTALSITLNDITINATTIKATTITAEHKLSSDSNRTATTTKLFESKTTTTPHNSTNKIANNSTKQISSINSSSAPQGNCNTVSYLIAFTSFFCILGFMIGTIFGIFMGRNSHLFIGHLTNESNHLGDYEMNVINKPNESSVANKASRSNENLIHNANKKQPIYAE
jgi:hypothetical protein